MDRLSKQAMLAKQAKMSYGKWKATQEPVKIVKKEYPADWPLCEHCGKPFKPLQGKRFCDVDCRKEAYREKERAYNREYMRKRNARKKAGALDG